MSILFCLSPLQHNCHLFLEMYSEILWFYPLVSSGTCDEPFGMEDNTIPNSDITASSELNCDHAARMGRLNKLGQSGWAGAWCARYNDFEQWFQVVRKDFQTIFVRKVVDLHLLLVNFIEDFGNTNENYAVTIYAPIT